MLAEKATQHWRRHSTGGAGRVWPRRWACTGHAKEDACGGCEGEGGGGEGEGGCGGVAQIELGGRDGDQGYAERCPHGAAPRLLRHRDGRRQSRRFGSAAATAEDTAATAATAMKAASTGSDGGSEDGSDGGRDGDSEGGWRKVRQGGWPSEVAEDGGWVEVVTETGTERSTARCSSCHTSCSQLLRATCSPQTCAC